MEERWFIRQKPGDYIQLGKELNVSPIIARIIGNRDHNNIEDMKEYLKGTLKSLHNGSDMADMQKAVGIMKDKILQNKTIRIIGDYDIDGVTSTFILLETLKSLGAKVDFQIPDRMKNGYGLSIDLIEEAVKGKIDTIITCDNGIAAAKEIQYAVENDLTVIVTDHHEVPYETNPTNHSVLCNNKEVQYILPPAHAIVDPKRIDCNYPFKELCGAAVAYKFAQCLYKEMDKDFYELNYLLEVVAIATIGDVMDLIGENRVLVKEGLNRMRSTKNIGLKSLMEVHEIEGSELSPYHIGFVLGPCINATGRLDTAQKAVHLLQETNKTKALELANELKELNEERKEQTVLGVEQAMEQIETYHKEDTVLVAYLPNCHESLAGIIAGRLREKYYKPALVITDAKEGLKGSARSIESYDMYQHLNQCKELFTKYGGHTLAAGFSLPKENLDRLRVQLNQNHKLTIEDLQPKVALDLQLPISYINQEFIEQLEVLEPFGKANPKPLFVEKNLEIGQIQILGKNKNVLKCKLRQGDKVLDGIHFGDLESFSQCIIKNYGINAYECLLNRGWSQVFLSIAYYPTINEFRGNKTLQLNIQNYRL